MMINNMPEKRVIMVHQPTKQADYNNPPRMMSALVKAKEASKRSASTHAKKGKEASAS
ncbi:MAG: hypothetical protein HKM04_05540 [Legionellales bacterium]|nr:hypothetical protein [Legionellales bacterium]